jgi:cell division control protein 45
MMKQEAEEQIPEYDDIFRDDDSESEDEEDEFGEKRRRYDEESLVKRRDRREWEGRRKGILFAYERDSYFSSSSALYLYELAWKMSRDSNDLLWWAIIGHTDLYLHKKIEDDRYLTDNGNLQNHVSRLNNRGEGETVAVNCLKIQAESELNLSLYRHWSVTAALRHTPYTAAKFKTFSIKGEIKLNEFLADTGLPLQQCAQNYQAMDLALRQVSDL